MNLHPLPPAADLYCVPAALYILTGADPASVIFPALNRAAARDTLLGPVGPEHAERAYAALQELGYVVRPYRAQAAAGPLRARVLTWARRAAERWPGRAILLSASRHALVVQDGRVYDTFAPFGAPAAEHAYAYCLVYRAALVEPLR